MKPTLTNCQYHKNLNFFDVKYKISKVLKHKELNKNNFWGFNQKVQTKIGSMINLQFI